MKKAKNRHLVAVVPSKQVDLFEIIEHVLIKPALTLQEGYNAKYSGSTRSSGEEYFIGSIFSIQGDHKGQAEISGLLGASATHASRYSTCPKSDFWKSCLDWEREGIQLQRRDSLESHRIITEQLDILQSRNRKVRAGSKTIARIILKRNGFAEKVYQSATRNL